MLLANYSLPMGYTMSVSKYKERLLNHQQSPNLAPLRPLDLQALEAPLRPCSHYLWRSDNSKLYD